MRKRVSSVLGLLAVVVILSVVFSLWPSSSDPGVNLRNARRLRAGMPEAEVASILGGAGSLHWSDATTYVRLWKSDEKEVIVHFDSVNGKCLHPLIVHGVPSDPDGPIRFPVERADDGPVEMIRRWLRL